MISKILTCLTTLGCIFMLFLSPQLHAQIYIDTGHPDVEKLKDHQENINIYQIDPVEEEVIPEEETKPVGNTDKVTEETKESVQKTEVATEKAIDEVDMKVEESEQAIEKVEKDTKQAASNKSKKSDDVEKLVEEPVAVPVPTENKVEEAVKPESTEKTVEKSNSKTNNKTVPEEKTADKPVEKTKQLEKNTEIPVVAPVPNEKTVEKQNTKTEEVEKTVEKQNTKTEEIEKTVETPVEKSKEVEKTVEKPVQKSQDPFASPATTTKASNGNVTATSKPVTASMSDDLPPNAERGKCYARCYIPDQYDFKEEIAEIKPVSYKAITIPATYKTVFDTVITKAETKRVETVPAEYEYLSEEVMIAPSSTQWVKKPGDPNCLSADPADCQVMCLEEIPAKYKTVQRKVVKTPSYTREIVEPAEFKIIAKQVQDQPSKTVQSKVPATYTKVLRKVKIKEGGYQEWREVVCGDQVTSSKIRQIQLALKAKGYDPGPIDNMLGPQTRAALTNFQHDKGLPVGNLNIETMNALGVQ